MPFSYPTKQRSYGRDKFNMAPVFCKEDCHNPRQGLLTCLPLRTQSLTELKEPLTCLLTTASSVLGSESAKPMSPIPIMAFLCFQSPLPICLFGQEIVFYVYAQGAGKKRLTVCTAYNWLAFHILKSYWSSHEAEESRGKQPLLVLSKTSWPLLLLKRNRTHEMFSVSSFNLTYFKSCLSPWISRRHLHDNIQTVHMYM